MAGVLKNVRGQLESTLDRLKEAETGYLEATQKERDLQVGRSGICSWVGTLRGVGGAAGGDRWGHGGWARRSGASIFEGWLQGGQAEGIAGCSSGDGGRGRQWTLTNSFIIGPLSQEEHGKVLNALARGRMQVETKERHVDELRKVWMGGRMRWVLAEGLVGSTLWQLVKHPIITGS